MVLFPLSFYVLAGWVRVFPKAADPTRFTQLIFGAVAMRVFLAASEELVFRGAVLPEVGRRIGMGWGVVLSSALYAVAHLHPQMSIGSVVEILLFFAEGCGYAVAYAATGSLWTPTIWHATRAVLAGFIWGGADLPRRFIVPYPEAFAPWSGNGIRPGGVDLMLVTMIVVLLVFALASDLVRRAPKLEREWAGEMQREDAAVS